MKNKIIVFGFIMSFLMVLNSVLVMSQSVSIGNLTASPGENINVPININNLNNVGAITLFILYDPGVLTFNGITNIIPEGSGTLGNGMTNPTRVGIVWSASTGGVNFPNGKYLDLQFTFLGGLSSLDFTSNCEIVDWDANPINATYTDGSVSSPSVNFNLTVFMEGAYQIGSGGMMSTDLLNTGSIPESQPYGPELPYYGNLNPTWYYEGMENLTNLPSNTVDWVLVELRDAATAVQATEATIVAQKACLLMSNGSIRELDGVSIPSFFTSFSQGAFVVVWHRNHLGIMSANPVAGLNNNYTYNFSLGSNKVYGGAAGYKNLETGINLWGMAAGDINGDKMINIIDKTNGWEVEASKRGYKGPDTDVNGQVDNIDKNDFILRNNTKASGVPN
jgi:hypothetical protein